MENDRTIPLHGGGEMVIGGGPPLEGLVHLTVFGEDQAERCSTMIGVRQVLELSRALQLRQTVEIKTFHGKVRVTHTEDLAHLWFYAWGEDRRPEMVCRLYDGAKEAAAEAFRDAYEDGKHVLAEAA